MEKLYEAFLDNWEKHAPDFFTLLMGVRDLQAPWQRKRAFRHGVSKKPDERQGNLSSGFFYGRGLLPYRFPKKARTESPWEIKMS